MTSFLNPFLNFSNLKRFTLKALLLNELIIGHHVLFSFHVVRTSAGANLTMNISDLITWWIEGNLVELLVCRIFAWGTCLSASSLTHLFVLLTVDLLAHSTGWLFFRNLVIVLQSCTFLGFRCFTFLSVLVNSVLYFISSLKILKFFVLLCFTFWDWIVS